MAAAERDDTSVETYLNPVHARDFPDPFVLKFAGEYWAYCTGLWRGDGRAFGVMRSRDLVRWDELGGALESLPGENPCYWAPEVSYRNGKFLMYYSVGNEKLMQVRVAVASHPAGPFTDSGRRLTSEEFAIDPHVFVDRDNSRYLFYATDFLTHTHVGTGTVVDRLTDDFTPEGRPRPVTRARFDWQVYDPARAEKGGVRWHTVEGPFVLERKGLYYEMFSGGNWQNVSYGVSYAVSESVLRDDEWEQYADGARVLPILRTVPGKVVGPGHNSVVRGPDNRQLFCVYHRWAPEGRVLAIDPLEFVGERMTVLGPTTTPQPAPILPTFADYFDEPRAEGLGEGWECVGGRWSVRAGEARQESAEGEAKARCVVGARSFVAELSLRAHDDVNERGGAFGVCLDAGATGRLRCLISPDENQIALSRPEGDGWSTLRAMALPPDFNARACHLLRAEIDGRFARVTLDETVFDWRGETGEPAGEDCETSLSLFTRDASASFRGFALTRGFTDDFDDDAESRARGWEFDTGSVGGGEASAEFRGRQLVLSRGGSACRVAEVRAGESFELVVNLRLDSASADADDKDGAYNVAVGAAGASLELTGRAGEAQTLAVVCGGERRTLSLPEAFDPGSFQQFRLLREGNRLRVGLAAEVLCELAAGGDSESLFLSSGGGAVVVFDSVRWTAIKKP